MRFQAASLCLVMMLTSFAPALAQEAAPAAPSATVATPSAPTAAPSAPVAEPSTGVDDLVKSVIAESGALPAPAETDAPVTPETSEASPESPAPPVKRARKPKGARKAPIVPVRETYMWSVDAAPAPEMKRKSPGMMAGGTVLTVVGGLGVVGGLLGLAFTTSSGSDGAGAGLAGLGGGAVLVGVGVSLLSAGAKKVPAEVESTTTQVHLGYGAGVSSKPTPPPNMKRNSPAMLGVGIPLIVAGGISTLATIPQFASGDDTAAAVTLGAGVLGLGVGIPLTVVGAKKVPVDAAAPVPQAQLRVGAGSVDFSMEF